MTAFKEALLSPKIFWLLVIPFLLAVALWAAPTSWYGIREYIYYMVTVPISGICLFAAYRQKNIGMGVLSILAFFANVIALALSFLVMLVVYGRFGP